MELKKSSKADLNKSKGLFYQIGLVCTLSLVIGMFAWSQTEKHIENFTVAIPDPFVELPPLPIPEQQPETSVNQIVLSPVVLNIVENSRQISQQIDFREFNEDEIVIAPITRKDEIRKEDEIFVVAEDMPSFMGGELAEFRNWVMGKLVYPTIAIETGIQGKVLLSFVIEKDGSLTGIEILQSPDNVLSQEAQRVLKQSPKWEPGKQRNVPVRVRFTMPVDFQLN